MATSWAVTQDKIDSVVERIVELVHPRRVIVFGSAASGELHDDSDLDLLIVTRQDVARPRRESVRIRSALADVRMPMDLLLISERRLQELVDQPGLIYREAARHGKVGYESPS
ncbi:MAG: nucleotidyltransferase domain-containing protein [Egibacteraceae bacterium]